MEGPAIILSRRFSARTIAALYFVLQALAVLAWWVLLFWIPDSRDWFFPRPLTGSPLMSFWLADLILLGGGSLFAAYAVALRRSWAAAAVWLVVGAICYPTLYCIVLATHYGEGMIGAGLMGASAGLCLAFATIVGTAQEPTGFRVAPSSSTVMLFARAGLQIVIFWGLFLWLLPLAITEAEGRLGVNGFEWGGHQFAGWLLFALAGPLGLWSAVTMAMHGRGTPLPTDCAPKLVIAGPYRYLRNPMATAGILQGLAVGVILGSVGTLLYALTGAVLWHFGARPAEELDLLQRFGEPYRKYRAQVRCWVPTLPAQQ